MTFSELRRNAGYSTQEELAIKMGVKNASISRWETGERRPSLDMVEKLAKVLNTSCNEIVAACNLAYEHRKNSA